MEGRKGTIYVVGKIGGNPDFRGDFARARDRLYRERWTRVITPDILSPLGLEYEQHITICNAMIDASEAVYLLGNWKTSPGAIREKFYAMSRNKVILFEEDEDEEQPVRP
ncbi:MAG: DUF4406 domain-containing protein [Treponema sp.]|nr:DUF4406 domain-containing protein [Treponema sp.]MBQ7165905.1 DUF4406 domain-containing protein [Treponema sp.]